MQGFVVLLSVARVPDYGVEIFFVGPGCTAQIGIEFLGAKFGGGDGETDTFLARGFGQILLIWYDVDLGLNACGAQVAFVKTIIFFVGTTDCSHLNSPFGCSLVKHSPAMRDGKCQT
jgi:hypothetical protein